MGIANSKGKKEEHFDFGHLKSQGLYKNEIEDYDIKIVSKLITQRRLAPFYLGLNDLKELETSKLSKNKYDSFKSNRLRTKSLDTECLPTTVFKGSLKFKNQTFGPKSKLDISQLKTILYNENLECPICFLVYLNYLIFSIILLI